MCDQDHFEEDRRTFEERGWVTRRQFGVLVGAAAFSCLGMMLASLTPSTEAAGGLCVGGEATCWIARVLVAGSVLSEAEQTQVRDWLQATYGL